MDIEWDISSAADHLQTSSWYSNTQLGASSQSSGNSGALIRKLTKPSGKRGLQNWQLENPATSSNLTNSCFSCALLMKHFQSLAFHIQKSL
jgi:hypothetical protein